MDRPKVLVTNIDVPKVGLDLLSSKCNVTIVQKNDDKNEVLTKVRGVDGIYWASHMRLDKDIIDAAGPQLKAIATMSAGYNHIDVAELKKRGIKLGNTPKVLNNAVADIAVLLALGAARRMNEAQQIIHSGNYTGVGTQWMLGRDIEGSTVGVIGLGGIGQAVVKRLKAFNVNKFLYTGHREKPEGKELGAEFVSLDTLARQSDFIIVACPLTDETRGMCNAEFFKKMKNTGIIVNISRGEVIDQDALVKALKTGEIYAAGLDVTTPEPLPTDHELIKLPNCVLMPHLGSATQNTRNAMSELAAQNLLLGLGDAEMITPVV